MTSYSSSLSSDDGRWRPGDLIDRVDEFSAEGSSFPEKSRLKPHTKTDALPTSLIAGCVFDAVMATGFLMIILYGGGAPDWIQGFSKFGAAFFGLGTAVTGIAIPILFHSMHQKHKNHMNDNPEKYNFET